MRLPTLSLLSLFLVSAVCSTKAAQIGFTSGEASRAIHVPLNDCHDLDVEDVTTLFLSKKCLVFIGPLCTGKKVELMPGEHSTNEPVPIGSVYCLS